MSASETLSCSEKRASRGAKSRFVRIRLVNEADVDALYELSLKTGGGMTNLPMDKKDLARRVAATKRTVSSNKPAGGVYLFIAETAESEAPLGVAALFPRSGAESGFLTYRIETQVQASREVDRRFEHKLLVLSSEYSEAAEIAAIFVDPDARGIKLGRALVRACLLFLALHRKRFPDRLFAEMRGWDGPNGEKPFWDEFLVKFFDMDFKHADHLNGTRGNYFLNELMPHFPIYLEALSPRVHEIIGRPHPDGERAFQMLKDEGLREDGHYDPFDLGPCLSARIDELPAVQEALAHHRDRGALKTAGASGLVAQGLKGEFECLYDAEQGTALVELLRRYATPRKGNHQTWVGSL